MKWEFKTADELLRLCGFKYMDISDVMLAREVQLGETTRKAVMDEVDRCLRVMNVAVDRAISDPSPSMGGFLGGEAQRVRNLEGSKSIEYSSVNVTIKCIFPASSSSLPAK